MGRAAPVVCDEALSSTARLRRDTFIKVISHSGSYLHKELSVTLAVLKS